MEINETNNYSRLLYIPRGLAIPFVALQYSEVKISIEIKKIGGNLGNIIIFL